MTSTHFRGVVFDMDGLLLDSERPLFESWQAAARELGCAFAPELLLNVLGRGGKDGVARFRASLGDEFPFEDVRVRAKQLLDERTATGFAVKDGARAFLIWLREHGVPCAIASSTRRAQIEEHLTRVELREFFAAIAAGDEVAHGKPAPDIFALAAERLAVAPAHCLVFEDSEHGARGAVAAGMQVVIVPDLSAPSEEARAFSLAVLGSLRECADHYTRWFAEVEGP